MKNTGPQRAKLETLKPNPKNPRVIKDDKFQKLVQSIRAFPQMLEVRPIVCTPDGVVLGGNMRLRACKEAGLREVPVHVVSWLDSQQEEFIIKDNVGYGEWDWDILANEWDANQLEDWGLDVWTPEEETEVREKDTEDQKWKLGDHTLQVKEHALPENTTQIAVVIQAWENFTGKKAELVTKA
jgi:hypothetical protein